MDHFPSKEALIAQAESKIRWREHLKTSLFKGPLRLFFPPLRWMVRNGRRIRGRNIRRLFGPTLNGLTIEVRNINFENKGSELMLHAILDRIGASVNASMVLSP